MNNCLRCPSCGWRPRRLTDPTLVIIALFRHWVEWPNCYYEVEGSGYYVPSDATGNYAGHPVVVYYV